MNSKDISYWLKRIKEDIYEPDKIIIDLEHAEKSLLEELDNNNYTKCEHNYIEINGIVKYMECSKCGDKLV